MNKKYLCSNIDEHNRNSLYLFSKVSPDDEDIRDDYFKFGFIAMSDDIIVPPMWLVFTYLGLVMIMLYSLALGAQIISICTLILICSLAFCNVVYHIEMQNG